MKKLISIILSVVLLFSMLAVEASAALEPIYEKDENGKVLETIDYKQTVLQYLSNKNEFKTDEEKLASMTLKYEKDGYQLYADEFTGEVATVNMATGEVLFSNPRDVASSTAAYSDTTRYELMSQLIVKYLDNGTVKYFYSFEQAAMNGQISIKNIKNGLRVEYTIGREDTKYLVPRLIEKDRFDTNIRNVLMAALIEKYGSEEAVKTLSSDYIKVNAYYAVLKDPNNVTSDRELAEMQAQYPITKKSYTSQTYSGLMAVYVCSAESAPELREVEQRIKTYCPNYTYEQLEYDHALTEYTKTDRPPALFKMALEYRLDEMGLSVRLPANGIRFNESEYQLEDITILPWMGCGSNENTGYTFYPDGSGAIFRFEDLDKTKTHTITGQVYGQDYAYHTVTGTHQEIIRYPVFGLVENVSTTTKVTNNAGEEVEQTNTFDRGYVAIIEEGEALAKISLKHFNAQSKYNTVHVLVNPRPKDSYILSDAVSVGSNSSVTVISERKYVGDYKIRYMMLGDEKISAAAGVEDYYDATWVGMATAYRDYLTSPYSTGTQNLDEKDQVSVLNRLTSEDVKADIPLYIETFGAIETVDKILSIPVNVKVSLTSFDDIQKMYDDLEGENIKNVNFKLTGYYNGGMYSSVPYRLKFEKAVGGKEGFKQLLVDAKNEGYGVFVDFDFAYASMVATTAFDGLSNSRDLVKSIDDRYTSKQYYSATRQAYTSYFELAISPARFEYFYDKVSEKYLEYNPIGISLSTLASELNSDFDEDEPYNREDSKKFTAELLEKISNDYSNVMADSANAYTWRYIDHMVNASVDSSRYTKSSAAVPFLGVVLHGYVQFAGTPMNMEGNIGTAMLKAIENGSGLYFILSYTNTEVLKEDELLSQYYSVRYDIWFDELVERYHTVNDVLADLQTKLIINHEFLIGERVPDEDEVIADKEAAEKLEQEKAEAEAEAARIEFINKIREGRFEALEIAEAVDAFAAKTLAELNEIYPKFVEAYAIVKAEGLDVKIPQLEKTYNELTLAYEEAVKEAGSNPTEEQKAAIDEIKAQRAAAYKELIEARKVESVANMLALHKELGALLVKTQECMTDITAAMEAVQFAYDELTKEGMYDEKIVNDIVREFPAAVTSSNDLHQ